MAWNIKDVASQKGKIAIVTGSNSGIGYETALALAGKEATVILACRNEEKAFAAKAKILKQHPQAEVLFMQLDLSSLVAVRTFVGTYMSQYATLDILINNAGILLPTHELTVDGFENQLATNYIGHFTLTGCLLPLIEQTPNARIVTVSSLTHSWFDINFEDLHFKKEYSARHAYAQSKLTCLMFAYEFQRRLTKAGHDTLSLAAHPGFSYTSITQYFPSWLKWTVPYLAQSSEAGALPTLYAALASEVNGGEYFGPDGWKEMWGNPTKVNSSAYSKDEKIAKKLWELTEEMTNVKYFDQ